MAIEIPTNFEVQTTLPLDVRDIVADVTARNSVTNRYEGLIVYQADTEQRWQLKGGTANSNWVDITEFDGNIDGGDWT